jgi:hypothetical protein
MNYYDENDDRPKLYGGVAAAIYTVAVAALMLMVYIPLKVIEKPPMEIVLVDQPPRQP